MDIEDLTISEMISFEEMVTEIKKLSSLYNYTHIKTSLVECRNDNTTIKRNFKKR